MQIPTNHITDYAEGGISLRSLTMGGKASSLTGLHRDDYYLFCLLTRGELRLCVDFSEQVVHAHEIGCILPGQVHQFVDARDTEGWLLCVDGVHIGEANRQTMQRFAFSRRVLPAPERQEAELVALFPMLHCRLHTLFPLIVPAWTLLRPGGHSLNPDVLGWPAVLGCRMRMTAKAFVREPRALACVGLGESLWLPGSAADRKTKSLSCVANESGSQRPRFVRRWLEPKRVSATLAERTLSAGRYRQKCLPLWVQN